MVVYYNPDKASEAIIDQDYRGARLSMLPNFIITLLLICFGLYNIFFYKKNLRKIEERYKYLNMKKKRSV